ncbi:hypothetical protein RWH45_06575 [Microbacterium sp. KSW4-17]|uniref:Fido domain-containing protein n=1 Tax=Microbacterium galbum TaxID=3075994 RepID=A0ABU3T670_9MICO|nr:hypothetical protein [Microbacterium sp. KSW4-17]MDU0366874.1 hypothetical protein [Microbacterium sp. KSW4-17]
MPEITIEPNAWDAKIAQYASTRDPDALQAVPEPEWRDLSSDFANIRPTSVERAEARFRRRIGEAIQGDAFLENITYTLPEIEDVLGGTHVPGHTEGEELQVIDMKKAADSVLWRIRERPTQPSQELSDGLHMLIASNLNLASLLFRGDQRERYNGPFVRLGRGRKFQALDARLTHDVLDAGLPRILSVEHPVVRGATWAAFAAYQQFYFDGNKRTGRYVMNTVAMSHGFDAIVIPTSAREQYVNEVVNALETGDLTSHIAFLLSLYDDGR